MNTHSSTAAIWLFGVLGALVVSTVAQADPADLDTTFGAGGTIVVPIDAFRSTPRGNLAVLQPDGKLLVAATTVQPTPGLMPPTRQSWLLIRYTRDGSPDDSFGNHGSTTVFEGDSSHIFAPSGGIALLPDGRFVVAGEIVFTDCGAGDCFYGNTLGIVARFNADGSLDTSFGSAGVSQGSSGFNSLAVESDGNLLVGFTESFAGFRLNRITADGSKDLGLAQPPCSFDATGTFHLDPNGKIVSVTNCTSRLNADGTLDTTFGMQGTQTFGAGQLVESFLDNQGALTTVDAISMRRLTPDGVPDAGFGVGGLVSDSPLEMSAVAGDCFNRTIVAGLPPNPPGGHFMIARFLPDGSLDATFSGASSVAPNNINAVPVQILPRPDGRIVAIALAGNELDIVQYQGDSPCSTATAVEYYYPAWDYYFETAFPDEIQALDSGAFGGVWQRTGQTFKVWPQPNASTSPTCRFFSASFAPKSSHFYTPFPAECGTVKTNPGWQFEGIAFHVQIPTGFGTGNGYCPEGTVALYRAYNNGMGGAPNHRYTASIATLNAMIAQGWIFEGEVNTKVFACVPQ